MSHCTHSRWHRLVHLLGLHTGLHILKSGCEDGIDKKNNPKICHCALEINPGLGLPELIILIKPHWVSRFISI